METSVQTRFVVTETGDCPGDIYGVYENHEAAHRAAEAIDGVVTRAIYHPAGGDQS